MRGWGYSPESSVAGVSARSVAASSARASASLLAVRGGELVTADRERGIVQHPLGLVQQHG